MLVHSFKCEKIYLFLFKCLIQNRNSTFRLATLMDATGGRRKVLMTHDLDE